MKKLAILMILTIVILANAANVFAHWRTPEELVIQDPMPEILNQIK